MLAQCGARGIASSLSIRGGESKYNLVQIDGVPVNSFYYGGLFDFLTCLRISLDRIEVIRGPQSAIYGPYANSGVVNFVTRSPEDAPRSMWSRKAAAIRSGVSRSAAPVC